MRRLTRLERLWHIANPFARRAYQRRLRNTMLYLMHRPESRVEVE